MPPRATVAAPFCVAPWPGSCRWIYPPQVNLVRTHAGAFHRTCRRKTAPAAPSATLPNPPLTTNKHLIRWVEKTAELCQPARIHWLDGSEEENASLCAGLVEGGTFQALDPVKWPGCFYAPVEPE